MAIRALEKSGVAGDFTPLGSSGRGTRRCATGLVVPWARSGHIQVVFRCSWEQSASARGGRHMHLWRRLAGASTHCNGPSPEMGYRAQMGSEGHGRSQKWPLCVCALRQSPVGCTDAIIKELLRYYRSGRARVQVRNGKGLWGPLARSCRSTGMLAKRAPTRALQMDADRSTVELTSILPVQSFCQYYPYF